MIKKLSMSEATNQSLILLGSSHQVADLSAREKISLPAESIDDFYKTRKDRSKLSKSIHPMLRKRGVPGTHDLRLMQIFFKNVNQKSFNSNCYGNDCWY